MRTDILERKEEILQWISELKPNVYIAQQLNCKVDTLVSYYKKMGIKYSGNQGGRNSRKPEHYIASDYYLVKNGPFIKSHTLKQKLIREGIKEHKCEQCNLTEWNGQPIPIELDHIDGHHYNNELSNLRILCPNCHAQTPTHSGRNRGKPKAPKVAKERKSKIAICGDCGQEHTYKYKKTLRCESCAVKARRKLPDASKVFEVWKKNDKNFWRTGVELGVTDNAIKGCLRRAGYLQNTD